MFVKGCFGDLKLFAMAGGRRKLKFRVSKFLYAVRI
jgi:hypothetical protein